ncbi:UNVERIFIED_CONTAM: hypothetical protein RMT77_012446 [Armadillidium vulgare]
MVLFQFPIFLCFDFFKPKIIYKYGAILKKRTGVEEQCGKMQCPTNPISEKEKESQIEKDKNTSDHNSTTTTNQKSSTTTKAVKRKSDEINSSATCTQITKKKKRKKKLKTTDHNSSTATKVKKKKAKKKKEEEKDLNINDQNSTTNKEAEEKKKKRKQKICVLVKRKKIKIDIERILEEENPWKTSASDVKKNLSFPISECILGNNVGDTKESPLEIEGWGEFKKPYPKVPSLRANPVASVKEENKENLISESTYFKENVKPPEYEEIASSSSPQKILSDSEIDIICSDLWCLCEKKIVLLSNYSGKMNLVKFIEDSLKFSGFTNLFFKSERISESLWESSLLAESGKDDGIIISMAYSPSPDKATKEAVEYIVCFFLKYCFTIFVKEPISTEKEVVLLETLLSPKPAEERRKSPVLIESVNENLVKETNVSPLFLRNVNSLLEDMNWRILNKEFVPDLEFSLDLSLQQTGNIRRIVYEKYDKTLEATYRYNIYLRGENLVISAKWNHLELFRHLLRNGGSIGKYHLHYPNTLFMNSLFEPN